MAEDEELTKTLVWYKKHREEVLARQDWGMVGYDIDRLRHMRRVTKRRWLRNLERVQEAWERERSERPKGVPPITKYFWRLPEKEGGPSHLGTRMQ